MPTKAFEAKRAIKAIADTMPSMAAENAQVTYGHPTNDLERKSVQILKVEWESSSWKTNRSREEVFNVSVRILVFVLAGTALDSESVVEALTAEFEDAIKAKPDLGVTGVINTSLAPKELDSAPSDGGWIAGIDYDVRVTARI